MLLLIRMKVIKRNGESQNLSFDKISYRLKKLANEPNLEKLTSIDFDVIAQEVIKNIYDGVETKQLDEIAARLCISLSTDNTEYASLSSRIAISNLHKNTTECFSQVAETLYNDSLISQETYDTISNNKQLLNDTIDYSRDYAYDYFGLKTLERSYLLKNKEGKILERPQSMIMRVAIGIHKNDIKRVIETYNLTSQFYFTHASPTLFNAGTNRPALASCFHESTKVATVNRGPVKIKDVKIGDSVVTHRGNVQKVTQLHKNKLNNRKLFRVEITKTNVLLVTGNHRLWTIKEGKRPCWKEVEQLTNEDYVGIPNKLQDSKFLNVIEMGNILTENEPNTLIKNWVINEDFAKFLGIFYSRGHIIFLNKKCLGIKILLKNSSKSLINFCINVSSNIFGIEPELEDIKGVNMCWIMYKSEFIGKIFDTLFENGRYNKKVWDGMYSWSSPLIEKLIEGIRISSSSLYQDNDFISELYYLLRNSNGDVTPYNSEEVVEYSDDNNKTFRFLKYIRKTEIKEKLPDYVYTIGVLNDHSYSVEGIVAENCFLTSIEDSMSGIYKTLSDCALISKHAGGIGVHVSNIRSSGSYIKGTNGKSDGIVKMLKVFNETARFANQGSKRNGSIAVYLEPHHADILEFLELRKNTGDESLRARDLFYAMWISDLFMECVEKDYDWYLMSEDTNPGLTDVYGDEYTELYYTYVAQNNYRKKIKARELWQKILISQIETGMPYMSYKDSVNKKSNQKNIGIIKSSNLCVAPETQILTSKGYYQISNLENTSVKVWNGKEFSETIVVKTNVNQELIRVSFSDGSTLECTKYHKFYIKNKRDKIEIVEAQNLEESMTLIPCKFPVIDNEDTFTLLTENKVPINSSIKTKIGWLENKITKIDDTKYTISNKSKYFIRECKYLLQTLGFNTEIKENLTICTIVLLPFQIIRLCALGFGKNIFPISGALQEVQLEIKVSSIVETCRYSDTYCFNEPTLNRGIFNGVITGNCNEITLVSNKEETAVCNICTFSLPKYLEKNLDNTFVYNHQKLYDIVKIATRNMNNVIDYTFYPIPETEKSNLRHRPIAMGIQGLANLFFEMSLPFESDEARTLNKEIMETIQYAGWTASMELAKEKGTTYDTYLESPISKGIFQHNMWNVEDSELSGRWDWNSLRQSILKHGVMNSMITALPPTASTSQILGNYESFEPQNSNMFMRSTLSGDFPIINKYLINDLKTIGLWTPKIKNDIILDKGSVQNIKEIPKKYKDIYKTIWEVSNKTLLEMSRDRALFVDQSQSFNVYMEKPTVAKLSSMHFYGWKLGLKTGLYYLRSRAASSAQQFTVEAKSSHPQIMKDELVNYPVENQDSCQSCSG